MSLRLSISDESISDVAPGGVMEEICCCDIGSIDVVKDSQSYFAIDLPSYDLKRRQDKFILRYISTVNGFCQFCKKL